jgi:5-methylcytosine-specific restriction endonuclease McrA
MIFLNNFRKAITQGKNENTYKMCWAKSLLEISLNSRGSGTGTVRIPFEDISKCFIKYYWDHEIYFKLKQSQNPNKRLEFLQMVEDLIERYFKEVKNREPVFFIRAESKLLEHPLRERYLKMVKKGISVLKKDVSYKFPVVGGEPLDLYDYTKGDIEIKIKAEYLKALRENSETLSDVIYFRWAQILENWNYSPKIAQKVKVITTEGQEEVKRRKNLNWAHPLLELYNPGKKCFLCPSKILEKMDIHHVLPYSFMFSDDLWNLVFTHKDCNIAKSNSIPTKKEIDSLKGRNKKLLEILQKRRDKGTQIIAKEKKIQLEMEVAYEHGYVDKFYNQIKL